MPIISYTQPDSIVRNGRPTILSPVEGALPSGVGTYMYDGWAQNIVGASGLPSMTSLDGRYKVAPSGWSE